MFGNYTILYVEDEDTLREAMYSFLISVFKDVITANNGKVGLEKFIENKEQIDLVITDINMPKLNGLDMVKKIKDITPNIPVIITTAYNDNKFLHKAIDLGVSRFVTKPVDIKLLIKNIEKVLEPYNLKQKLKEEQKLNLQQMVENAKFSATGKLAAGITHEINTPLTFIKANIELMGYDIEDLENSNIKVSLEKSIEKVNEGIERIENIVNSIKEISIQKTVKIEPTNIYSTIITAATLAWNRSKHIAPIYINGNKFDLNTKKDNDKYIADVQIQRIEQVWIIILNNAIDELAKQKDAKQRRLDIDLTDDEKYIYITFKDNAGGIAPDIIDHIFEPFKGTKESSGMGVGLSIARKIIEDHESAKIEAYNEENCAIFKISLLKTLI